jgi:hypothetical protein
MRDLMKNFQKLPNSFNAKLRAVSSQATEHDTPLQKVQISFQSLFFSNEECHILRIKDITANKLL